MRTKIFGGIAIVAIALAVAFNVSLNTGKTNNASLLALANVEALAGELSEFAEWWNSSPANLTGLQYKGQEAYSKRIETGSSVTTVPTTTTSSWSIGLPDGISYGSSTTQGYQTTTVNYEDVKCCKDSYSDKDCSGADWRC